MDVERLASRSAETQGLGLSARPSPRWCSRGAARSSGPDSYHLAATIQVVPAAGAGRYIPSNVNSEMTQRINAMLRCSIRETAPTSPISLIPTAVRSQVAGKAALQGT